AVVSLASRPCKQPPGGHGQYCSQVECLCFAHPLTLPSPTNTPRPAPRRLRGWRAGCGSWLRFLGLLVCGGFNVTLDPVAHVLPAMLRRIRQSRVIVAVFVEVVILIDDFARQR